MERSESTIDRAAILAALWTAARGTRADRARLSLLAARAGAERAAAQRGIAALVAEFDAVESAVLGTLSQRAALEPPSDAAALLDGARRVHEQCARMRRAACLAYGRALGAAVRERIRVLRHDVINAVGAVRNALVMMDDEVSGGSPERFRAIALRNAATSEHLLRSQLTPELTLAGIDPAPDDATAFVLEELSADQPLADDERAAVSALAASLGVVLHFDDETGQPQLADPPGRSARNERHDLGRARERDDLDALGF